MANDYNKSIKKNHPRNFLNFEILIIIVLIIYIINRFLLPDKPATLSISEPVFIEADDYTKSLGYNTICETNNAFYRLKDEVLDNKVDIIKKYETMFKIAKEEYEMEFNSPIIFISENLNDIKSDFQSFTVCIDSPYSMGFAFYHASGGKLPAWICMGLENYWAEVYDFSITANKMSTHEITYAFKENNEKHISPFGDAWLISNFNKGTDVNLLKNYSYNFIRFLADSNKLFDYIDLAINDYSSFIDYSKEVMDLYTKDIFNDDHTIFVRYDYGNSFSIHTVEAIYKYETHNWNWEDVESWTDEMDAGIRFVEDFINFKYNNQLDITLSNKNTKYTSKSSKGIITLTDLKFGPEQSTHEAAHALCYLSGIEKNTSVFFIEGFASLLSTLYDNEYKTSRYERYHQIILNVSDDDDEAKAIADYNNRIIKSDKAIEFNIGVFADSTAIIEFKNGARRIPLRQSKDFILGNILDKEMYSYSKAESFLLYLYNNYGKEKLLEAYRDNSKIEEIYGKSLEDLVIEWKNFLNII